MSTPTAVEIRDGMLSVRLHDERLIATPLDWYPFLDNASPEQRTNVQLKWDAIWWPDLDEGLSIEGVLREVNPREEQAAVEETVA